MKYVTTFKKKNRGTNIFYLVLLTLNLFSTQARAKLNHMDNENVKHIQYYNNIRKDLFEKNKFDKSSVDFRRLRFSAMVYIFFKETQSLANEDSYFLSEEKKKVKTKTQNKNDNETLLLAQTIFQEDITYLPALKILVESNAIEKKTKKNLVSLYEGLKQSLLGSGDGKGTQTAYEVFGQGDIEYLIDDKCNNSSITEQIEKNGRKYSHLRCGDKVEDDFEIYMDITSKRIFQLAPRTTSFADEFKREENEIKALVENSSKKEKILKGNLISEKTKAIADSMANEFIVFYRERQWEPLWELFKEKSQYFNPHEAVEKEKFYSKIREIYDTCGILNEATFSELNQFKHGMSLTKSLEYQFKAKYEKCEKTIFLEIWTVKDSIDNFKYFGLERRKDK